MGITEREWSDCCTTIGLSLKHTYNRLTGDRDPQQEVEFSRLFTERADQVMADLTELYDGVPQFLRALRQSHPLGLISNIWSHPKVFEAEFFEADTDEIFCLLFLRERNATRNSAPVPRTRRRRRASPSQ